jgi:hypothetical protein
MLPSIRESPDSRRRLTHTLLRLKSPKAGQPSDHLIAIADAKAPH